LLYRISVLERTAPAPGSGRQAVLLTVCSEPMINNESPDVPATSRSDILTPSCTDSHVEVLIGRLSCCDPAVILPYQFESICERGLTFPPLDAYFQCPALSKEKTDVLFPSHPQIPSCSLHSTLSSSFLARRDCDLSLIPSRVDGSSPPGITPSHSWLSPPLYLGG